MESYGSEVCVNIMSNNLVRYLHVFEPTQHQRRYAIVGEMGVHIYFWSSGVARCVDGVHIPLVIQYFLVGSLSYERKVVQGVSFRWLKSSSHETYPFKLFYFHNTYSILCSYNLAIPSLPYIFLKISFPISFWEYCAHVFVLFDEWVLFMLNHHGECVCAM